MMRFVKEMGRKKNETFIPKLAGLGSTFQLVETEIKIMNKLPSKRTNLIPSPPNFIP